MNNTVVSQETIRSIKNSADECQEMILFFSNHSGDDAAFESNLEIKYESGRLSAFNEVLELLGVKIETDKT